MRRAFVAGIALGVLSCFLLAGCAAPSGGGGTAATADEAHTLHMIAGSEVKDLEPLFPQIQDKTGVALDVTYSGTLAGIDRIRGGEHFDAAWFANAKYLLLGDKERRVKAPERSMLSPVVVGVKESVAKRFGWTSGGTTWKAIASRAGDGSFRFAMTNPTSSNSGFSALIAVASALAGAPDALRASDVDTQKLRTFFRGQRLTAGSSGWLIDAYLRDQEHLDGIVNYEANLLQLDKNPDLKERLVLLYPKEGIVTADYPLLLLDPSKKDLYDKVVAYLTSADVQQQIVEQTFRRPVNPDVKLTAGFPTALINEVSFPNSLASVDGILQRYLNEDRVPAHTFYVIDTSGSMQGERLDGVKAALHTLAGDDPSLTGKFARFQNRERISIISFSDAVTAPVDLEMRSADDARTLAAVRSYADGLRAGGATAIYCALESALGDAAKARAGDGARYTSIVLMTDGENNRCDDEGQFEAKYRALPRDMQIKVFPILFGEGSPQQLESLATLTGGRLFDAKNESLSSVFKDIRGYQ
jgi:Ca-activated chloride channel family protein